jgi:hypothetical protein
MFYFLIIIIKNKMSWNRFKGYISKTLRFGQTNHQQEHLTTSSYSMSNKTKNVDMELKKNTIRKIGQRLSKKERDELSGFINTAAMNARKSNMEWKNTMAMRRKEFDQGVCFLRELRELGRCAFTVDYMILGLQEYYNYSKQLFEIRFPELVYLLEVDNVVLMEEALKVEDNVIAVFNEITHFCNLGWKNYYGGHVSHHIYAEYYIHKPMKSPSQPLWYDGDITC